MSKYQIENRIFEVVEYAGTQDLIGAISKAATVTWPDWIVARACMTAEEYADFGQEGRPWHFLKHNPDACRRAVFAARKVVENICRDMGIRAFKWLPI